MEDRQSQVASSLSVLNPKKSKGDAMENRLLLGMTEDLDGIAVATQQDDSEEGSDENSSMGAIPEVNSDDESDDQTRNDMTSLADSTIVPMKRAGTN